METSLFRKRLADFRSLLATMALDGFIVPMTDRYQSEYVCEADQRIAFLCGFTGSAGILVVLKDRAAFFTDGRYTLQARMQLEDGLFEIVDIYEKTPTAWLVEKALEGSVIGYDPWLHTDTSVEKLSIALTKISGVLKPVEANPVDFLWVDRPSPSLAPAVNHALDYTGASSEKKIAPLAETLKKKMVDALFLSDSASIAWVLNIRGDDVPHTPLALSYAILHADKTIDWFIRKEKITARFNHELGSALRIHDEDSLLGYLHDFARAEKIVQIDALSAPSAIVRCLRDGGADLVQDDDPCLLARACKNATEIEGMREAHVKDASAVINLLAWLDRSLGVSPLTEMDVARELEIFRQATPLYCGSSFDTIAGAGEHGAIVHYHATGETNKALELGTLLLMDCGAHYPHGTTDLTRTILLMPYHRAFAVPDAVKDRYTRVLKGHIALSRIVFPEGTSGAELDVLARQFLWQIGCDYAHGTGHGVGCFLSVHEGPQGISRRNKVPLQAGMVLSNEPGFYWQGHFGIRLENLMAVIQKDALSGIGDTPRMMLGFETLSLVPFDTRLIDRSMLARDEVSWLNDYHALVRARLAPCVLDSSRAWLDKSTAPLA